MIIENESAKPYWWEELDPSLPIPEDKKEFLWGLFDRMDAVKKRVEQWEGDHTTSLLERDAKLTDLRDRLDELSELINGGDPGYLEPLQQWYFTTTNKQRNRWLEGLGPNMRRPDETRYPPAQMRDMQTAYDLIILRGDRPSKRKVAMESGYDRNSDTFKNCWNKLRK